MQFIDEFRRGTHRPAPGSRRPMTTSDFPGLLGGVIDRTLLGGYRPYPTSYQDWCSIYREGLPRTGAALSIGDGPYEVKEARSTRMPPERANTQGRSSGGSSSSWEAFQRRPLGAHDHPVPARHCCQAHHRETRHVADLRREAGQMRRSSASERQQARACPERGQPEDGRRRWPTSPTPATSRSSTTRAVVPPALKDHLEIVKTIQAEVKSGDNTTIKTPWASSATSKVSVAPYISKIITGTVGKTAWFLFADPAQLERPAVEIGFLRGHEEPQLFMKSANASMIGGGDVSLRRRL